VLSKARGLSRTVEKSESIEDGRTFDGGRAAACLAITAATAGQAMAAIDTAAVTDALTDAATALAVVGAAYVAMRYGAAVWRWLTKFAG